MLGALAAMAVLAAINQVCSLRPEDDMPVAGVGQIARRCVSTFA